MLDVFSSFFPLPLFLFFSSLFFFSLEHKQAAFEYPNTGLFLQGDANYSMSALLCHVPLFSPGLGHRL